MLKTRHFILLTLFGICTLFYYFGELVDFVGWKALRWEFFYSVHDIHRLLFLAPIIYAGYFFGSKEAVAVTVASLITFLPRAIFISPFPDAIPRAALFAIFAGIVGFLTGVIRNKVQQSRGVRTLARNEGNKPAETGKGIGDRVFTAGNLEIDLSRRLTKRGGRIVKLTPKEYELLLYLIRNIGKVISHEELLHNVWGPEYGQENEYLRTFIRQLRLKIEDDPSKPRFIVTEPVVGYRFVKPE